MSERKPDVDDLIRAGRAALRPQPADRERVLQSLARTLGAAAVLGASSSVAPPRGIAWRFPLRGWVMGGLGAMAVGAGVLVSVHSWPARTSRASLPVPPAIQEVAPAPAAETPTVSSADDALERSNVETPSGAPRPRSSVARAASDSLPEEVVLLSRAERELSSGQPGEALKTLGEHERRFPGGALAEERMAARVQSLCALGRVAEAGTEIAKLARAYPRSPHLDRARRFCGIDAL